MAAAVSVQTSCGDCVFIQKYECTKCRDVRANGPVHCLNASRVHVFKFAECNHTDTRTHRHAHTPRVRETEMYPTHGAHRSTAEAEVGD